MANKTKMTKRDYFNAILSKYPLTDAEKDFVKHELELLEKKNSSEKKPTAQQAQNEVIKTAIAEGMSPNRLYTVTEIQKEIPECVELSNQRVSALLRQMKDDGIVTRTEDKRKAYFSIVE
jgi:DNA-binding transcriptional regulator GbsR (MarR family)